MDCNDDEKNVVYVPSSSGHNQNSESILYGETYGDRREWIEPYNDPRAIMKCTGRIVTDYGDRHKITGERVKQCGTGTVFHVQDGFAFIITAAHNVVKNDHNDELKYPLSIFYLREVSKIHEEKKYEAEIIAIHDKYMFRDEDGELIKKQSNDLAIIRIKDYGHKDEDQNGFYQRIFSDHSNVINLFCSDDIPDNTMFDEYYHLYGYPCPLWSKEKYSKATDGQLWGMKAKPFEMKENGNEM